MNHKRLQRREALVRMAEYLGAAAGISAAGVKSLVAQGQKQTPVRNLDRLLAVKPVSPAAKFIKIMVFPREDVFLNVYGRKGQFHWGSYGGGSCIVLAGGGDFTASGSCQDHQCGEDDCPELFCEGTNQCGTQNCGQQKMPALTNLFSAESLEKIRTDPFIRGLFRELGVTTSEALSAQLKTMVRQHRR